MDLEKVSGQDEGTMREGYLNHDTKDSDEIGAHEQAVDTQQECGESTDLFEASDFGIGTDDENSNLEDVVT